MQCDEFRGKYSTTGMLGAVEYRIWVDHMNHCPSCADWYMAQEVAEWGGQVSQFPCVHVAYYATLRCRRHGDPLDCPECLVVRRPDGAFAIPVRDGSSAASVIRFCPWCGTPLAPKAT